jgi:2-(1,2-epoxy-1,2-dihydrophenyl)acetyl-CoA isomerase
MDWEEIIFRKVDARATIVLNRPEKLNAYTRKMEHELRLAIADIEEDNDVKAVIITGAGRGFCSGHDLREVGASGSRGKLELRFDLDSYPPALIASIPKPVIGAINGVAAGGGLALALACDIRIASEEAIFYESHVSRMGLPPGLEVLLLPRLVGLEKALEMIFTGEKVDAQEALRIGLVSRVVPGGRLIETVEELVTKIAGSSLRALMLSKKAVYQGLSLPIDETMSYVTLSRRLCVQK